MFNNDKVIGNRNESNDLHIREFYGEIGSVVENMRMENTCEIRFFVERDRHARDTRNIRRTKLPLLFETVSSVTSSSSNIKNLLFCRNALFTSNSSHCQ